MACAWFPSTAHLYAALRSVPDDDFWRRPATLWELADGGWLLATEALPAGVAEAEVSWPDSEQAEVDGTTQAVVRRRDAEMLFQVLPLVQRAPARVDVSALRVHTAERFVEVASANLMLGNHRLRYLALGGGAFVLLVERLSEFLRAKWAAAEDIEFFYVSEHSDALWLPAGWTWPPASLVRLPLDSDHDRWLVEPDGTWRLLPGELREVEQAVQLAPGSLTPETITVEEPPLVEVELRLEPSEMPAEARLWRLREAERPWLLRLLQEAPEADLAGLQLAALRGSDGPFYLLLARVGGGALGLGGGLAYAARHATENLFLPLGYRLAPSLSRETLARALELDDGTLTLLDRLESGRVRVTRVPRAHLRPVLDLVDHLASEAADEVQQLLGQVVFDFDLAAEAPAADSAPPEPPEPGGCLAALLGRWGRKPPA